MLGVAQFIAPEYCIPVFVVNVGCLKAEGSPLKFKDWMRPRLLWIHSWPKSLPGPVKSIENHAAAWGRTGFGCRKT